MESIAVLNIEVTSEGMCERSGRQRIAFVPSKGIERIEVANGFVAERVPLQIVFAGLIGVAGLYLLKPYLGLFVGDSWPQFARPGAVGAFLLLIALAVLFGALRRGPHLRVTTAGGVRKLTLRGKYEAHEIETLLADARRALGIA